jgi:hypothetical protein
MELDFTVRAVFVMSGKFQCLSLTELGIDGRIILNWILKK